jgi:hypothetical protein
MLYSGRRIVAIIEQRWLKRISFSTKGLAHALSENDCNLRVRRGGGLFDRGIQLGWSGLARVLGKRKTMRRRIAVQKSAFKNVAAAARQSCPRYARCRVVR